MQIADTTMVKFGRGFWREEGKQTKFNRDFLMSPQWVNWKYIKHSRLSEQKAMQSHHSTEQIFQETPWESVQKTEKPAKAKTACPPPLCCSPPPVQQGLFCGTCRQVSKAMGNDYQPERWAQSEWCIRRCILMLFSDTECPGKKETNPECK